MTRTWKTCTRPALILLAMLSMMAVLPAAAQINNNQINNGRRLTIQRAIYGMNGKGADVTNRVRSLMRNDSLDFKVNNTNLGVDPNEGTKKSLKLSYTYMGRKQNRTWNEGDQCRVP
jgi:hypothetical protein